ncbi:MAG: hemolysin family protein [Pelagibacteraceae bacterium]|jgi:magnesium and cobalt transporter|uniref:hemolysin family protein n=1 Tax=Candidatus Pelagibacter sp. HIMB1517 TaxID=3413341 RepID=UPI0031262B61|tara:strand:- start:812 stop:1657 length:846 start_codon:yes stop_codon:yes gene_type:complete
MSKKENLNIISKLIKKINFLGNNQSLRDSIKDVIDEKSNEESQNIDLSSKEKSILSNILSINKLKADDVMIPRASIVAISQDSSFQNIIDTIDKESHSRMPVFRKDLDDVLGMIHIKDIIKFSGSNHNDFNIKKIMREVLFVPPTMPVMNLLLKMQATKLHMALVIDEHGGTDGLITIEDVIEEIVGEIEDEHDKDDDFNFKKIDSNTFEAKADMTLDDFNHESNLSIVEENVDTLGGYIFSKINRVPYAGEVIKVDNTYQFEIIEADPRKIKKIRIFKIL